MENVNESTNQNPITLEAAVAVVLLHLKEAKAVLAAAGHKFQYMSLVDVHDGKYFYASGAGGDCAWGSTPLEAAKAVPTPKTRIEKLRAELAELEKAEAEKVAP